MDKQVKIFENKKFGKLRTLLINNKPYIVAIDVARALDYKNTRDAIKRHCRWVAKHDVPHPQSKDKNKTIEVNCIPEGDIYRLVAHSKLPEADITPRGRETFRLSLQEKGVLGNE